MKHKGRVLLDEDGLILCINLTGIRAALVAGQTLGVSEGISRREECSNHRLNEEDPPSPDQLALTNSLRS